MYTPDAMTGFAAKNLADSHCHLQLLEQAPEEVVTRALAEGIRYLLCVSVAMEDAGPIQSFHRRYPDIVSGSVGLHPNQAAHHEVDTDALVELARLPGMVAVGETGLDYYRLPSGTEVDTTAIERQQQGLRRHIQAARTAGRPLIIHCRDAWDDTLRILKEEKADEVRGVMHCFTGDYETASKAMDLNFMISFSGIVSFKNARDLQQVATKIPDDYLLIETDCPYLAPVPHRGKPNEPAFLVHTAQCLAQLRAQTPEQVEEIIKNNYLELFQPGTRH